MRPRSAQRLCAGDGTDAGGLVVTPQDRDRIAHLGRWYSLSVEHLARMEMGPEHWHPAKTGLPEGEVTHEYTRRVYAIKRRMAKLARVAENPGNHTGPLVGSVLGYNNETAWYATRYGATAATLPWTFRSSINAAFVPHAWMAADAGMQLESLGYRVLSERELATGVDRNGDDVTAPIMSTFKARTGSTVDKKPDVAVLAPDGHDYIAVEVERDRDRPLRTYTEKLTAYRDNSAIRAVWYLCGSMATANRVGQAASKVLSKSFPLTIAVMADVNGLLEIPDLIENERLMADLHGIDPAVERRAFPSALVGVG